MAYDEYSEEGVKRSSAGDNIVKFLFWREWVRQDIKPLANLVVFPSFKLRNSISGTETDTVLLYIWTFFFRKTRIIIVKLYCFLSLTHVPCPKDWPHYSIKYENKGTLQPTSLHEEQFNCTLLFNNDLWYIGRVVRPKKF